MPTTWLPNTDSLKRVLEMLCRAGTLESARSCHDTFTRHPTNQYRLRFSLVLQAYFEAAKNETSDERRRDAVVEALAKKNKGLTREVIQIESKLSNGGGLTRILHELEESSFIRSYSAFGKKERRIPIKAKIKALEIINILVFILLI